MPLKQKLMILSVHIVSKVQTYFCMRALVPLKGTSSLKKTGALSFLLLSPKHQRSSYFRRAQLVIKKLKVKLMLDVFPPLPLFIFFPYEFTLLLSSLLYSWEVAMLTYFTLSVEGFRLFTSFSSFD